jgi:Icc-related predicted phosphoesterase
MARPFKLYFATDLHGSEKCFRKFLNAAKVYRPDLLVLGGDLAGKAIQAIVRGPRGRWRSSFRGQAHEPETAEELAALEKLIADHGYYPYRAEEGELEARQRDGTLDAVFLACMKARLGAWLSLADERLRPAGVPLLWMLGNDDPPELGELLDQAPWGEHAEGRVLEVGGHELLSWGWSNVTPWHTWREMTEEQLEAALAPLCRALREPRRAILNLHVPPYGTGLDEAPVLDDELRVQTTVGQVRFAPVGSPAVRRLIEQVQPLLGLHGHIHESAGFRRLGATLALNPGSDYGTGALNGALVALDRDRVRAYQLVRG